MPRDFRFLPPHSQVPKVSLERGTETSKLHPSPPLQTGLPKSVLCEVIEGRHVSGTFWVPDVHNCPASQRDETPRRPDRR